MDFEGIVIFSDFLSVLGEGSYAICIRLCSPNTLFSFCFFSKRVPLASHFGAFWRPWAHVWLQGGAPGWFWRALKKRSKREVLRNHARPMTEGGPYRDRPKDKDRTSNLKPQDAEERD